MIQHVLGHQDKNWSRLALSVLVGVLESLTECTPRRIGHTYLRRLQQEAHPPGMGEGLEPFLTKTKLGAQALDELRWWSNHLSVGRGRVVRGTHAGSLVPSFGDGSGTGAGGTFQLPDGPLQMWKGPWTPGVYHHSSNWKELETLRLSLQVVLDQGHAEVRGCSLFYFTDNSTTYWICSGGTSKNDKLQGTLERIRLLEVQLGCHLIVVHVPGLVMIQEGTDGLSRGLWINPWHGGIPREDLLTGIFAPHPVDPPMMWSYITEHIPAMHAGKGWPPPPEVRGDPLRQWDHPPHLWDARGTFTVWFPPPECARHVLSLLLEAYAEEPLQTSALLFIPRIVPAAWRGLSKALVELPSVYPHLVDLACPPLLPIPVTVIYLPPHHRTVGPSPRLDIPPPSAREKWHRAQAAEMRGMWTPDWKGEGYPQMPLPEGWVPPEW